MADPWLEDDPDFLGDVEQQRSDDREKRPTQDWIATWVPISCPRCGGRHVPAHGKRSERLRYHSCSDCGLRFKSVEVSPDFYRIR